MANNGLYSDVCAIILLEAIEDEVFEKEAYLILENDKIDDDKKFLMMSLMKQKGLSAPWSPTAMKTALPR